MSPINTRKEKREMAPAGLTHAKKRNVARIQRTRRPGTLKLTNKSQKAGIRFPVGRITRQLREKIGTYVTYSPFTGRWNSLSGVCICGSGYNRNIHRYSPTSGIWTAAVLEYLTTEILELAGNTAKGYKKKRITPRHILLAIKYDGEMDNLLQDVIISDGGVMPNIPQDQLPKNPKEKAAKRKETTTRKKPAMTKAPPPPPHRKKQE